MLKGFTDYLAVLAVSFRGSQICLLYTKYFTTSSLSTLGTSFLSSVMTAYC